MRVWNCSSIFRNANQMKAMMISKTAPAKLLKAKKSYFKPCATGDLNLDPRCQKRLHPYMMTNKYICQVLKHFTQWNLSYHLEMKLWMNRCPRVITIYIVSEIGPWTERPHPRKRGPNEAESTRLMPKRLLQTKHV
jgi:hypothetical protein